MKKIYQKIDDPKHGDCFKCSVATLLGLEYDDVPNFIEYGDLWWCVVCKFFAEHGYTIGEPVLMNPNISQLENPTNGCFDTPYVDYEYTLHSLSLKDGINGLFLASVYSPKYTSPSEHPTSHLHSVVCDSNFNIVFDPQLNYKNILKYPYSDLIGYNGIRAVDTVRKIKNKRFQTYVILYYTVHLLAGNNVTTAKSIENTINFLKTIDSEGLELPSTDGINPTTYGTITIDYENANGDLLSLEVGKTKIGFFTDYKHGINEESDGIETDFNSMPDIIRKHIEIFTQNE